MANTILTVGNGESISGSGLEWSNPSNITIATSHDAKTELRMSKYSNYLRGTDCGFNIPSNAIITGIRVHMNRRANSPFINSIHDENLYLVKDGSIISGCDNKASSTFWSRDIVGETIINPNAINDLWSCTLTPAIINDSTFGLQLSVYNISESVSRAYVKWMKIEVYYTLTEFIQSSYLI